MVKQAPSPEVVRRDTAALTAELQALTRQLLWASEYAIDTAEELQNVAE